LTRVLLARSTRDVAKLSDGDHSSLLSAYADDFVLHFNEGDHRWSGDWIGKSGMDRFLQNFTAAGALMTTPTHPTAPASMTTRPR
jgi:hypothetical protein